MEGMIETSADKVATLRASVANLDDHEDIHRLFDTLLTIGNVVNGMGGHPRFWIDRGANYTPGGKVLEKLGEVIDFLIDDVVKHADVLPASTQYDREMKALTLTAWEVFSCSTPAEIIARAAPLMADTH